jgi:glycosyltransferase involved in cell wall biosynthesis
MPKTTEMEYPLISVIIPTYNRSKTIARTINSALNQTYSKIELIIVDDGSSDNTSEILNKYNDPRIRLFTHEKNKGVTAAKNTGLRNIKGEWFTTFDSDDEMLPEAIETMISIPLHFDNTITAVSCNCIDTSDNEFTGKGLTKDQYLDVKTLMTKCKGDFWGLTKTSLLMNEYFNETLSGFETVLWYKIDDRAKRYYIHKALSIVHTEGDDRISNSTSNFKKEIKLYSNLIYEDYYLNKLRIYTPRKFNNICKNGLIVTRVNYNKNIALKYFEYLKTTDNSLINKLILKYWIMAFLIKKVQVGKQYIKSGTKIFSKR